MRSFKEFPPSDEELEAYRNGQVYVTEYVLTDFDICANAELENILNSSLPRTSLYLLFLL